MGTTLPTYCVNCGAGIDHRLDKPGRVNECGDCGAESDVERLGGNMIFLHKTAPELEIKPLSEARAFAARTARYGAGVTRSLVESKLQRGEKEATGARSDAAPGAEYNSSLGEKHSLKR